MWINLKPVGWGIGSTFHSPPPDYIFKENKMVDGTFCASFNSATIFGFYFQTFSGLEEHPQYIGISIHIILQYLPPFQHFILPSFSFYCWIVEIEKTPLKKKFFFKKILN